MNIPMQTRRAATARRNAFTLIEMIGVLAVIAILAAVLIPKVFQAINDSRVNNAAMTCNTVKTAVADHYAKAGSLVAIVTNNVTSAFSLPVEQYDVGVLVPEQFLDKPFATKIGDNVIGAGNTRVRAFDITGIAAGATVDGAPATGFALSNTNAANDMVGSACVEAVITGVTASDAKDLNDRIDGSSLGAPNLTSADLAGRVKYVPPTNGVTTVLVYLTHR